MADQLHPGIAVVPEFVEGEQPSAAKLNSLGAQMKRAADQLESAVGDLRGQSWPYSNFTDTKLAIQWGRKRANAQALAATEDRSPDIANIARLIGPASNLNPRQLGREAPIEENVPIGVHEFTLRYVPTSTISASEPVFSDNTVFANFKSSRTNLQVSGDYHVTGNGKVFCVDATTVGTVTYDHDPRKVGGGLAYQNARFNVLPDPNQLSAGGTGLSFGAKDVQGRYPVTLPDITHQQSNIEGGSTTLDSDDVNYLAPLQLPKVLTDNFSVGEALPAGIVFLKNWTTNEVFECAEYYYNGNDSVLVGNIAIDDQITAGDKFVLLTVGTDITTSIDDLRVKSFHSHDRDHGEPFVALNGISGFTSEAGNTGVWVPSEVPGNFAPQYLNRDGWTSGVDGNLNDENAMRGDLFLANKNLPQGSRVDVLGSNSAGIRFGDVSSYIFRDSDNRVKLNANSLGTAADGFGFSLNGTEYVQIYENVQPRLELDNSADLVLGPDSGIHGGIGGFSCRPFFYEGIVPYTNNTWVPLAGLNASLGSATIMSYQIMIRDATHWYGRQDADASGTITGYKQVKSRIVDASGDIEVWLDNGDWASGNYLTRVTVWYY